MQSSLLILLPGKDYIEGATPGGIHYLRRLRAFSVSRCSTCSVNSSLALVYSSPEALLGKPAWTARTKPLRPMKKVVGQESQFEACDNFSLASSVVPHSRTV